MKCLIIPLLISLIQCNLYPYRTIISRNDSNVTYYRSRNGSLLYGIDHRIIVRHPFGWINPPWYAPTTSRVKLNGWQFKRLKFEIRNFEFNTTVDYRSWRKDANNLEFLINSSDKQDIYNAHEEVLKLYKEHLFFVIFKP